MTGIQVTPEQLAGVSQQLTSGAANIDNILAQLRNQVSPLQDSWKGMAQAKFEQLWTEWQTSAKQLHEALTGIATLTSQASQTYAETEQRIASTFN